MFTNKIPYKGFTLIELMIAVLVVSIVASVGFVTYSNAQMAARDAKRKSDLRSIASALELYHAKNGRYPCIETAPFKSLGDGSYWITDIGFSTCGANTIEALDADYINPMPHDPKNHTAGLNFVNAVRRGYMYSTPDYGSSPSCPAKGQYFVLYTRLDNVNDPDSCMNKLYKACDGGDLCNGPQTDPGKGIFVVTSD